MWKRYIWLIALCTGLMGSAIQLAVQGGTARVLWEQRQQEGIAGEVLRFHVLANSDSASDQAAKMEVKAQVLDYLREQMPEYDSAADTRLWIGAHLEEIRKTAQTALAMQRADEAGTTNEACTADEADTADDPGTADKPGTAAEAGTADDAAQAAQAAQAAPAAPTHTADQPDATAKRQQYAQDYPVEVRLLKTWFPEKSYGDCEFPAGIYEALQVRIGRACGHNWWCVLYPSLCFTDALHGVVSEEQKRELKHVLTEDEYDVVTGKIRYRIRFRWLDSIFLNVQIAFSGSLCYALP